MPRTMLAQWTNAQMDRDLVRVYQAAMSKATRRASTFREALEQMGFGGDREQRRIALAALVQHHHPDFLRKLMSHRVLIAWSDGTLEIR